MSDALPTPGVEPLRQAEEVSASSNAPIPDGAAKARKSHLWDRHPDDWYIEEKGVTLALLAKEPFLEDEIYDPAFGSGRIVAEALQSGHRLAWGTDIVDRTGCGLRIVDFTKPNEGPVRAWNIITNPPFKFCDKSSNFIFMRNALACARLKCAFLLPSSWKSSAAAIEFYQANGLYRIYDLSPRPSMPPGPVVMAGEHVGGGMKDFSWFVFLKSYRGPVVTEALKWERSK